MRFGSELDAQSPLLLESPIVLDVLWSYPPQIGLFESAFVFFLAHHNGAATSGVLCVEGVQIGKSVDVGHVKLSCSASIGLKASSLPCVIRT